jgi:TRAP transporter 4TM/12TM fusion protein
MRVPFAGSAAISSMLGAGLVAGWSPAYRGRRVSDPRDGRVAHMGMDQPDETTEPRGAGLLGLAALWLGRTGRVVSLIFGLLIAWVAGFALIDDATLRVGTIGLSVLIVLLLEPLATRRQGLTPGGRNLRWAFDGLLLVGFAITFYWFFVIREELWDAVYDYTLFDIVVGYLGLFVTIELTRRTFGMALAVVTVAFLLYALLGQHLPWIFRHAGVDFTELIRTTWYSFDGVLGRPTGIVAGVVLIFVLLGSVLEASGAGAILLRISIQLTARIRGGPAHAAIVASALFGTLSGSTIANVVGTGVFTIPMIKKRGFSPSFAGAVEAAASSGGQVTPPIMAAAAFVVAEYTNTPYLVLCVAALLPALFKYLAIFAQVYTEAVRLDIAPIPKHERQRLTRRDWIQSLRFFLPIAAVLVAMGSGWSPAVAGLAAVVVAIVVGLMMDPELRRRPQRLVRAIAEGGHQSARIMVAVAAVGIILGVVNETGVAHGFATLLSSIAEGSLMAALVLAMLGALVLGMGLPTLPAYLIIVLIMGPGIAALGKAGGISLLQIHLFVLYFGVLSSVTPPVALAAYAAAPIAGAPPLKTAMQALRLSLVGFLIPYVFVFNPSLLLVERFDVVELAWVVVRLIAAIWMLATGFAGFDSAGRLGLVQRVLRFAAALVMLYPYIYAEVGGLALGVLVFAWARFLPGSRRAPTLETKQEGGVK